MFVKENKVNINPIKSDINILFEQFINGDLFTLELSNYLFKNIKQSCNEEYKHYIKKVKNILNSAKITFYYNLLLINLNQELTEEEKVVLVRYINICHYNKKLIILYNNSVIYIPFEFLTNFKKETIYTHIYLTYQRYLNRKKIDYILEKINIQIKHMLKKVNIRKLSLSL